MTSFIIKEEGIFGFFRLFQVESEVELVRDRRCSRIHHLHLDHLQLQLLHLVFRFLLAG